MPREVVVGAGAVVALAAVAGLYLGVSRSMAAPGTEESAPLIAPSATIANAKPILTPTPALDEATVRRLAREEAQAMLASRPAPKKAAASNDDGDDDSSTPGGQADMPTVPLVPAKPATPVAAPPT